MAEVLASGEIGLTADVASQMAAFAALQAAHLETGHRNQLPAAARLKTNEAPGQIADDMRRRRKTP